MVFCLALMTFLEWVLQFQQKHRMMHGFEVSEHCLLKVQLMKKHVCRYL